ncbi:LysE family translocator [Marinobacter confluentis]|uniref:LysE family translocator n=1 Tax=Marinobacter confluentis TaxID=1697557 RepID=A0A4Z1BHT9_9GAMM|nr:LysE family translocator [Marinobacter confluentis]TGN39109.1 LysE family translocator [Marinobacter confluentis]
MSLESWLAFVVASTVLLVIPGPTIFAVISYSVTHGRQANVPLVVAVTLGDCSALVASLVGLGALLAVSTFWFTAVKVVGGVYLLYLGIKLFRAGIVPSGTSETMPEASKLRLFTNTYLVTALNPKGIVFFVAFLPQFITPGENVVFQMWLLSVTFVALAAVNATLYTIFASSARRMLKSAKAQRRFNFTGGALLLTAGVWALLAKRPAV